MIHAFSWLVEPQSATMGLWALGLLGLLIGAAFLSGFLTPIIGAVSALGGIVVQFWFPGSEPMIATLLGFNTIVMALAICLLARERFRSTRTSSGVAGLSFRARQIHKPFFLVIHFSPNSSRFRITGSSNEKTTYCEMRHAQRNQHSVPSEQQIPSGSSQGGGEMLEYGVTQFDSAAVPVVNSRALENLIAAESFPGDSFPGDSLATGPARQLQQLIDFVPQQMFIFEFDGGLSYTNRAARKYLGPIDVASSDGWLAATIHPEDLASVTQAHRDAVMHGISVETDARVRNKDGEYCWFPATTSNTQR